MPYKSKAQEAYFNKNRAKLEAQGVNVDEYNEASKGMKLPERAAKLAAKPKMHRADSRRDMSKGWR